LLVLVLALFTTTVGLHSDSAQTEVIDILKIEKDKYTRMLSEINSKLNEMEKPPIELDIKRQIT
jgi:hypothetical protein